VLKVSVWEEGIHKYKKEFNSYGAKGSRVGPYCALPIGRGLGRAPPFCNSIPLLARTLRLFPVARFLRYVWRYIRLNR
jgi:hypothetical protein